MHLTIQSILLGAAVAVALEEPLSTPIDSPHWKRFPDPPSPEVLQCEHLVNEFVDLGNAYYIGTYRADKAPPKDRWRSLTNPKLPHLMLDLQKCQDLLEEYKEKEARDAHREITNPPPTVECLLGCLRGPTRTREEAIARAKCVRRCSEKVESPEVASNESLASSTQEARDAHPEGVVEKRSCASDCITKSHSKAEMTACFKKCVDQGEWDFTNGSTSASPTQAHDAHPEA